ncbi:MAG: hypothetical protein Q9180_002507, partial [Flavoplaca navasiana]
VLDVTAGQAMRNGQSSVRFILLTARYHVRLKGHPDLIIVVQSTEVSRESIMSNHFGLLPMTYTLPPIAGPK